MKKHIYISIFLIILGTTFILYGNLSPNEASQKILFTVPKGKSLSYVAEKLKEKKPNKKRTLF